jgi:hypothetical protein
MAVSLGKSLDKFLNKYIHTVVKNKKNKTFFIKLKMK